MTNMGINPYTGLPYNQNDFNGMPPAAIPVNDQVKETPAGSAVSGVPTTPDEFIKVAPYYIAGAGVAYLTQKGINAACSTDKPFAESNMAKFSKWIDDNKTLQKYSKSIEGWLDKRKKSLGTFKEGRSGSTKEIINHLDAGTDPVSSMSRSQYHGVKGMAADEFIRQLQDMIKEGKFPKQHLENLEPIINNKNLFGVDAINKIEEELGGRKAMCDFVRKDLVSTEVARKFNIPLINKEISLGTKGVNPGAAFNKYLGMEAGNTKTIFSRIMQKGTLLTGEATAGNVGGGAVIGLLMGAFCLGSSFKTAMEAPKGEKLSTFMEEFMGNYVGFMATMPVASWLLYKAAGARNISKEKNVAEALAKHSDFKMKDKISAGSKDKTIKDAIKDIVDDIKTKSKSVDGKEIKVDEKTAKAARDEIKALKSLANKETPLLQKPIKFIGRILGCGLEEHAATELYKNASFFKKAGNFLARHGGGSVRFILLALVLPSVLSKPFKWVSHLIFGTPTKKEEDGDKKSDAVNNTQASQTAQNQTIQNQAAPQPTAQATPQNTPANTVPTSIPPTTANQPVRTYMPSSDPVVLQAQQNTAVMKKIEDSDKVMKYCEQVMQGSH